MKIIDCIPFTNLNYSTDVLMSTRGVLDTFINTTTVIAIVSDPLGNDYYINQFRDAVEEGEIPAMQDRNTGGVYTISAMRRLSNGQLLTFFVVPKEG